LLWNTGPACSHERLVLAGCECGHDNLQIRVLRYLAEYVFRKIGKQMMRKETHAEAADIHCLLFFPVHGGAHLGEPGTVMVSGFDRRVLSDGMIATCPEVRNCFLFLSLLSDGRKFNG
jgi:hypothetical protein